MNKFIDEIYETAEAKLIHCCCGNKYLVPYPLGYVYCTLCDYFVGWELQELYEFIENNYGTKYFIPEKYKKKEDKLYDTIFF